MINSLNSLKGTPPDSFAVKEIEKMNWVDMWPSGVIFLINLLDPYVRYDSLNNNYLHWDFNVMAPITRIMGPTEYWHYRFNDLNEKTEVYLVTRTEIILKFIEFNKAGENCRCISKEEILKLYV
jgi:hypothetical protein